MSTGATRRLTTGPGGGTGPPGHSDLAPRGEREQGTVKVWGNDIETDERNAKLSIGVVPQELILDPFFTPRETLKYQSGYYGVPKKENCIEEILETILKFVQIFGGKLNLAGFDPDSGRYRKGVGSHRAGGRTKLRPTRAKIG